MSSYCVANSYVGNISLNGYYGQYHIKMPLTVTPGQPHLLSIAAQVISDNNSGTGTGASANLFYAITSDSGTSAIFGHTPYVMSTGPVIAYMADCATHSVNGDLLNIAASTNNIPTLVQGIVPAIFINVDGTSTGGGYPCTSSSTKAHQQIFTVPTGWPAGTAAYLDICVNYIVFNTYSQLALALGLLNCNSDVSSGQPTQLTQLPTASSSTSVNIASIGGSTLSTSTVPVNLVQMDSTNLTSATMPVNITQVNSAGLSVPRVPIDISSVSGTTFSTGSVPIDVAMVHASALTTAYVPVNLAQVNAAATSNPLPVTLPGTQSVNIAQVNGTSVTNPISVAIPGTAKVDVEQVLGSAVSSSNPLPVAFTGTASVNVSQVLGAAVSSSNPLPTTGGGGGFTGNTPATPLYVRDV